MLQLGLRKCPPGGFCDVRGPKLHPQSLLNACRDLELVMPAQGNHAFPITFPHIPHACFSIFYALIALSPLLLEKPTGDLSPLLA